MVELWYPVSDLYFVHSRTDNGGGVGGGDIFGGELEEF